MERSIRVRCKRYSRGGGKSAGGYEKYIKRVEEYCPKSGRWGKGKENPEYCFDLNLPAFCKGADGTPFWGAVDCYERVNGNLFVEMELAIPNELPAIGRKESILMFTDRVHEIAGFPLPTTGSIHPGKVRGKNYHNHMMFCERIDEHKTERTAEQWFKRYNSKNPERGGCQKIELLTRKNIYAFRRAWEDICNKLLKKYGFDFKVSCQSYRKRGIDRVARPHIWKEPADKESLNMYFWQKAVAVNKSIDLIDEMENQLEYYERKISGMKNDMAHSDRCRVTKKTSEALPGNNHIVSSSYASEKILSKNSLTTIPVDKCVSVHKDFITSKTIVKKNHSHDYKSENGEDNSFNSNSRELDNHNANVIWLINVLLTLVSARRKLGLKKSWRLMWHFI